MEDFHFIRPLWLFAFIALVVLIRQLKKVRLASSAWHKVIPQHLTNMLLSKEDDKKPLSLWMPSLIGTFVIIALAGPTWQKLPQPVFEVERGSVIIMDMSFSMLSTDIKPNRLTRARFKAMSLVEKINEGEIGLVAYAGDAFTISPLTSDIKNIELLLPSLSPDIMPELGSNPFPALLLANDMLLNAGHIEGDIYWITDGIDSDELQDINDFVSKHNHRLNILGVGTEAGAPITLANGELMKDRGGNIVIPKINRSMLSGISKRSGGVFSIISADDSDIETLGKLPITTAKNKTEKEDSLGDQWQEAGPYLLLIVLPLFLGYFRRGVLFTPVLCGLILTFSMQPQKAQASIWDDLWQTQNQQASKKFSNEQYQEAAEQFNDPLWKGSSLYKAGDYENALQEFDKVQSIDSQYNQGNTLAKMGELKQALEKYEQVLMENPDHADAKANKEILEKLMQQQEQQQSENSEDQEKQEQEQEQNESEQQQQQNQQGEDKQQDQQQNQEQGENNDPQDSRSSTEQNDKNSQDSDQQNSEEQNKEGDSKSNQQQAEQDQSEKEQQAAAQAEKNAEGTEEEQQQQQSAALSEEQAEQNSEENQKLEQLLNKVTDDPHLLLRNKMKLEYQKRRQNRSSIGVKEKW